MEQVNNSNNSIIIEWKDEYLQKLNAEKVALGIKHHRTQPPRKATVKLRYKGGEITVIGVGMTKGDVMTHKGKGRYPQNRKEKPWFNPVTELEVGELADRLAINTGDTICAALIK